MLRRGYGRWGPAITATGGVAEVGTDGRGASAGAHGGGGGRRPSSFFSMLRRLIAWNRSNAVAANGRFCGATNRSSSSSTHPAAVASAAASTPSASATSDTQALCVVESVVRDRWTCRQFDTGRPIDLAALQRVLAATIRAPTGFNMQGWYAVVVTDAAVRERLFQACLGQPQVLQAPVTVVFVGDTEPERHAPQTLEMGLDTGYYHPLYGAAYLRNVFYFMHGGPWQSIAAAKSVLSAWYSRAADAALVSIPVSRTGYAWKQSMIPATTFLHLCTAAGWNTCMMEGIDEGAVKRVLGIPELYTVPVVVSVGYATAAECTKRQVRSPRFAAPHFVRWNAF